MASRAEQKARTRHLLIDSWLQIIGGGTNFAAISLREVAKTAGVVPTSFYRHFDDMDELGLAAVDELGLDLRRLMRGSLDPAQPIEDVVREWVAVYQDYVRKHTDLVQFVNQARTGGTPALREAIDHELAFFRTRLAGALGETMPTLKSADRDTVAQVVLAVLVENTNALLALPARRSARRAELEEGLERKLRVVLLGAAQLAGGAAPPAATTAPKTPVTRLKPKGRATAS
jgi:AcrR family transcriptional regulator